MLIASIFFFSLNVFKRLLSQGRFKPGSCGKKLIATFHLSSAASLNLGRSQNGVLGNGLMKAKSIRACQAARTAQADMSRYFSLEH